MAGAVRTEIERERDLERIARLYLRGRTYQQIAKDIGTISTSQVQYDINEIRKRWRESAVVNFNEAVQRELDRIDEIEAAHWEAWERSFDSEKDGIPAYLTGAIRCSEQRSRILGLYAPERRELSGPVGGPISVMTDTDRVGRIAELLENAKARLADTTTA